MALSALLHEPPHALEVQAYAPRQLLSGHVNVDGTGVAWWPPGQVEPLRYRTVSAPWADANLPELAPRLTGDRVLAAVRSATPGLPIGVAEVAPFLADGLVFAHNGWVGAFRRHVASRLLAEIDAEGFAHVDAFSDSAVLFGVLLAARRRDPSLGLLGAVVETIAKVERACADHDAPATLNLVATDGATTVATRRSLRHDANSLHVGDGVARFPAARLVVSEPLDDDAAWSEVAPDTALVLADGGLVEHRLG